MSAQITNAAARAELRQVAEKATPGPWEAYGNIVAGITGPGGCGGCSGTLSPDHEPACYWSEIAQAGEPEAQFIAAFNPAVALELLDEVERLHELFTHYARQYPIECNRRIKAESRLAAVQKLYEKRSAETVTNFTEGEELFLADLSEALSGECRCAENPVTDGPVANCPQHGHSYEHWVEVAENLADRLEQ